MIFRRQSLEESELVRFTEHFGRCESTGRKDIQSPYHEQIIYFSTLKYADGRFVGGFAGGDDVDWHSDQTYQVRPATGAMLYGTEVPRDGGDIYWANQYGAWDLPAEGHPAADRRQDGHLPLRQAVRDAQRAGAEGQGEGQRDAEPAGRRHQLVLTHPRTGRKSLYADPTTLVCDRRPVGGRGRARDAHPVRAGGHPSLVYRHKVHNGDLLMWDNGCTMHRRDEMRLDQPRLMKRTTFRLSASDYIVPQA